MAAHPNKSTATGDYMEVELGEAEWTLDTLDALFGFYFVEPAKTAARKAAQIQHLARARAWGVESVASQCATSSPNSSNNEAHRNEVA